MPRQEPAEVNRDFVEKILSLPDRGRQEQLLRESGLLDESGLDRLLDEAEHLMGDDPGKTRRLAELCTEIAESATAPAAVPRANYVLAGTYGMDGAFERELQLIRIARDGYVDIGKSFEALRTEIGRMAALLQLGRYQEMLSVGQAVLRSLQGIRQDRVNDNETQSNLLTAFVYQNQGVCYELMGRYEDALDSHARAEGYYRSLGMSERLGEIIDNRGAILSSLGRNTEALLAHESAATIFDDAGLNLSYAKSLGNIGQVYLQLGNYTCSLEMFERVRKLLGSLDASFFNHILLLDTANAYLSLNLYSEALVIYQEVDESLQSAGMLHDRAQALWGMGVTLIALSEFEEAKGALDEAVVLFEGAGNVPLLSGVMLEKASLRSALGDRTGARETAQRALKLVYGKDWPVQSVYAHLRLADLLLPDVDEAESHLLEAQRLARHLVLPQLRYRLNERLGSLRRLQGRDEEARELLEKATDEIENLRGAVPQDAMRTSFLRDKTAAYEELLRLHLDREGEENTRHAFDVAERAKSRSLVDLLMGVTEREATSADPELEERIQALQSDLNAIYNQLLIPGEGTRRVALSPLSARAAELEGELGRLRLQAAATAPSDTLASPLPVEEVLRAIPSDVTLVAYHVVGNEVLAFVVAQGDIRVVRSLSDADRVQQLLQQLTVQWERLHAGGSFAERHAHRLERSTHRVLGALYDELLASLGLSDTGSGENGSPAKLVVVPHGPLHQVPFHALFDGRRYLLERFEVSYAPSATVYALSGEQASSGFDEVLALGVEDPTIPNAAAEVRAIAQHFPRAEVRTGETAAVEALRTESSGRDALHLACHGLFRADNPMFSALKLHDGWLMAHDVMKLDLDGALVTLSACESGRSEVIGGDEILGLTRAFLGAGAASLVVSLWLVQDETTAELMSLWYGLMREGKNRAEALRLAQLEVRERRPHPYYWAPFVLIGKR